MIPFGSKGTFDDPHQVQFHTGGVTLQLRDLKLTDTVLGADAAAELMH